MHKLETEIDFESKKIKTEDQRENYEALLSKLHEWEYFDVKLKNDDIKPVKV